MRRRTSSRQPNSVVVGWVEVWSTAPPAGPANTPGFAVEGVVPLTRPRSVAKPLGKPEPVS